MTCLFHFKDLSRYFPDKIVTETLHIYSRGCSSHFKIHMFSLSAQTCPSVHKRTHWLDMVIIVPERKERKNITFKL